MNNMNNVIIKEKYEANIHLNTLYDVLSALQISGKHWYPTDVNDDINNLLNKINDYTYHRHIGFDVIDEKWYSEFTFKKNR